MNAFLVYTRIFLIFFFKKRIKRFSFLLMSRRLNASNDMEIYGLRKNCEERGGREVRRVKLLKNIGRLVINKPFRVFIKKLLSSASNISQNK